MQQTIPTQPITTLDRSHIVFGKHVKLKSHQWLAHDFIVANPHCAIWLQMAFGKTICALAALQTIQPLGHILVIAPVNIAKSTWIDEIERHGFPYQTKSLIVNARGKKLSRKQRLQRYAEIQTDPPTMYFINQELVEDLVLNSPTVNIAHNGKMHEVVNWRFPTVIVDEAQGFKTHSANRTEALMLVRPAISRLIQLTGTPSPNGPHDLWAQIYLLDQGQALGHNVTAFRNRWFTARTNEKGIPTAWVPSVDAEDEINHAIKHLVMSADNTELQLPEVTITDVRVSLDPDLKAAYDDFKRSLVIDIVSSQLTDEQREKARLDPELRRQLITQVVASNQAILQSKLLQFANGTLYTADPDRPETKGQYEVLHSHKLDMLESLIRDNGGSPVLVSYAFKSDCNLILERMNSRANQQLGLRAEKFDSSNPRESMDRWNRGEIPVLLIHPASAGHGLNFQHGGHTLVWFGLTYNLEHYLQTNARLPRPGQANPVSIVRLLTRGTHDERMPAVLSSKEGSQQRLLDFAKLGSYVERNDNALLELRREMLDGIDEQQLMAN